MCFHLPVQELLKRLERRGHETNEVIQTRFDQAESELKEISWYDYVIFNDDLEKAANQLTFDLYCAKM